MSRHQAQVPGTGEPMQVSSGSATGGVAYGVILLTLLTAFIHLYLSFQFPDGPDLAFLLNGLGYLGLLAAFYVPIAALAPYRRLIGWVLIAYSALTIGLWTLIGARTLIAYVDKVAELILILLVWLEVRRLS